MITTQAQAGLSQMLNSQCQGWLNSTNGTLNYLSGTLVQPTYSTTFTTEQSMKDREKYLLVNRDTAAIVSRHEDEADAASEGARRAAKDGGVYLIFKAIKKVQPKPVDVESVDL